MYAPPVLFHVSVLSTICLHLISTCSVGHDPRDIWMMDPSISLVTCLVPPQRCLASLSWCVVHPLRCKGYGPYRQALPARESVIERVTPSFFSRSYTSLMPSRAVRLEADHDHGVRSHDPSQQSTYPWTLCSVAHVCAVCLLRDHNQREYVAENAPLAARPSFGYSPCLHLRRPPAQP